MNGEPPGGSDARSLDCTVTSKVTISAALSIFFYLLYSTLVRDHA